MSEFDDLLEKYSDVLELIYKNQTAGDFTFVGVLAAYTRELNELRARQASFLMPIPSSGISDMKVTCNNCGHTLEDHSSEGCVHPSTKCRCLVRRSSLETGIRLTTKENK